MTNQISKNFTFKKEEIAIAALVTLIAGIFYFFHTTPSVAAGDNGELATAVQFLGIAHSPGYPLYTFMGKLATFLPFKNVAWRVNYFSALCSSLTIFFAVLVYIKILLSLKFPRISVYLVAIITGLAYMMSDTLWSQSIIGEVYSISAVFHPLSILILLKWRNEVRARRNEENVFLGESYLLSYAFIFGVGLCAHQTIVLSALFFVVFFLYTLYENNILQRKLNDNQMKIGLISLGIVLIFFLASWLVYFKYIASLKSNLFIRDASDFNKTLASPVLINSATFFIFCQLVILGVYLYFRFFQKFLLNKEFDFNNYYLRLTCIVAKFMGMLFLGFCVYFYIFIRAEGNPPINWGGVNEAEGFWAKIAKLFTMINRKQFGSTEKLPFNLYTFFQQFKWALTHINLVQFSIPFYLIALWGLIWLGIKKHYFYLAMWLVFFISYNFQLTLFLGYDLTDRDIFFVKVFYIFSYFAISIAIAIGLGGLIDAGHLLKTKLLKK